MHIIDDETRRFGRLLHYAGVLVMVVCCSAGYSLLHAPAVESITDTSNRIDELMQSVKNAPVIREQHRIVSAKLNEVTTRIANVQRRVPQKASDGEFLQQVTSVAKSEKLLIKEFKPGQPETKHGYGELQVSLKGKGSFASICTFVDQLNKLARLTKVKDLTLTTEPDTNEYPLTATLVIYFGVRESDVEAGQEARSGG